MRSLVPATHVAVFTSFMRTTFKATKKAALLLFSVAVLLAGGAQCVYEECKLLIAAGCTNALTSYLEKRIIL